MNKQLTMAEVKKIEKAYMLYLKMTNGPYSPDKKHAWFCNLTSYFNCQYLLAQLNYLYPDFPLHIPRAWRHELKDRMPITYGYYWLHFNIIKKYRSDVTFKQYITLMNEHYKKKNLRIKLHNG